MSLETQMEILNNQLRALLLKLDHINPLGDAVPNALGEQPPETTETVTPAAGDVPGATGSQQPPAAGSVETDINGMPWDERIHSGAKDDTGKYKKTGKNVWQKRKGVSPVDFKRIEAEIMATLGGEAAIPSTTEEMQTTPTVGVPGGQAVGVPGGAAPETVPPVLVLPIPADINAATQQDCINITQVFTQMHGAPAMNVVLQKWHITDLTTDLPAHLYGEYVTYMVKEDAKLTPA